MRVTRSSVVRGPGPLPAFRTGPSFATMRLNARPGQKVVHA
jgi:hypothetical protein